MTEQILSDIVVVIVVLGVLSLGVLLISNWVFLNRFREDVLYMKMEDNEEVYKGEGEVPPLIDTYLRKIKAAEEADLTEAFVTYEGFRRMKPEEKWSLIKGEQFFRTDKPGFVWMGFSRINAVVRMNTIEKLTDQTGTHITRLWSVFPVNRTGGESVRQGLLVRYAGELVLCPQAFIHNPSVTLEQTGEREVTALVKSGQEEGTIVFTFSESGLPESAHAANRHRGDETEAWQIAYSDYRETASGVTVPHQLDSTWKLQSGDFHDSSIRIKTVHYEESNYKE
ncbi:hypothetical protein CR205_17610 [Alteribacter lacisalsi]|uniref:Uncharacterized protein n=1 Tax=Alteribacter lacisalsi TaxID=2045244 RepID=A0A2W0H573_9BACI|nr:DUF6544 family protein [Alteribacter lacisalsi]PYZ96181.1 hypothetical protein CR205_17610 [Alteribacter lacisalsi]